MSMNPVIRHRLEEQGFCGLDDATLVEVGSVLRWVVVCCGFLVIVGVALASPVVLWLLAATAFFGVFLPFHPFDLLYNYGVRYLTGTRPFPHNGPQRKFACGLASAWLIATGWAFHVGASTLGFALGVPLILVAALLTVPPLCIPSMVSNFLFFNP